MSERAEPIQEDPERPFETWWENYRTSYFEIKPLGPLGVKCREAAGDLIDELLGRAELPRAERTGFARLLTCLIYDSYLVDDWEYEESE